MMTSPRPLGGLQGDKTVFHKGQKVQYKDMQQMKELRPRAWAQRIQGLVGTIREPEVTTDKLCYIHGKACTLRALVEFSVDGRAVKIRCHSEHLIPLD